ncbi:Os03g0246650 [Oryza sativa Japonica Group]|uniref:Os03g0246650 protein n=1 Tax=Oryza sativa subsp. japonica TaxID=39947 RepID=B9F6R8_ORYSJ|nr:hypothetical protein OsJ_10126 [Oryza sativa Japonica Group]KAF2938321.1 hypothetical protein DAI22_03g109700 [Oryza sativa Japonica Group]BAH92074.1 Os03g0246650 [Oryza sativa Japonica Group]|eukprot:NP_001173346.1 Os03g0246650 [Oryza sativa Japonica Group]
MVALVAEASKRWRWRRPRLQRWRRPRRRSGGGGVPNVDELGVDLAKAPAGRRRWGSRSGRRLILGGRRARSPSLQPLTAAGCIPGGCGWRAGGRRPRLLRRRRPPLPAPPLLLPVRRASSPPTPRGGGSKKAPHPLHAAARRRRRRSRFGGWPPPPASPSRRLPRAVTPRRGPRPAAGTSPAGRRFRRFHLPRVR